MTQPEALRLADALEHDPLKWCDEAAAELRRLHAENFLLAAGQCVHATADEGGIPMCAEVQRLQSARERDNVSFKQLLAQRDALLAALRPFAAINASIGFTYKDVDRARAAIAKAQQ